MKTLIILFLSLGLFTYGCCGLTSQMTGAQETSDAKYSSNYGKSVTIEEDYVVTLDRIFENPPTDTGIKSFDITFSIENRGKEETSSPGAIYIKDTQGRYFEADYFSCSFLVNPGIKKTTTCTFSEVPESAELDAIMIRDDLTEDEYTLMFRID